ncbi:MAG: hypothetical protein M0R50_03300 [Candidatus Cloacimonetes bacterium]|jgi:vacuolar-type H+-ATPase subunit I/STV1|nr:hypothetical protein [Candidatus Cloacimonadota bacterium]
MNTSDITVDYLMSIYLNKAGRVNAHFTRSLKVATQEVRDATLAKIKESGLREYDPQTLKAKPTITRQKHLVVTPELIKIVLKEVEEEIIAIEKAVVERRKTLDTVRKYYLKKLAEFPRAEKQVENRPNKTSIYLDLKSTAEDLKSTAEDICETVQELDDEIRGKSPCDTCFG